jgi:hypothetical protein
MAKLAFAAAPPLSTEERKITRPAIDPLTSIAKTVGTQIGKLKTADAATACLKSSIAYCQRWMALIAGGSEAAPVAATGKPAAKAAGRKLKTATA